MFSYHIYWFLYTRVSVRLSQWYHKTFKPAPKPEPEYLPDGSENLLGPLNKA